MAVNQWPWVFKKLTPADLLAFGLVGFLAWLTLVSPHYLPFNMDEFLDVQRWFCRAHPLNEQFYTLTEGCTKYDLRLPLTATFLPLRTFDYIGNFSLTYYPFHYLIGDPIAHRVFGFFNYVALAWLTSLFFELPLSAVVLAFAAFPVFFLTLMLDTGMVGVLLQLFLLSTLAFRTALRQRKWSLAVIAGSVLFVGFFQRQNFLWLVIPFVILTWAPARKNWGLYGVCATVFGTLFLVYGLSETRSGTRLAFSNTESILGPTILPLAVEQWHQLRASHFPVGRTLLVVARVAVLKAQLVGDKVYELIAFHFDPTRFAFRHVIFPSSPVKYVLLFLMVVTVVAGLRTRPSRRLLGCYLITLGIMAMFELSWAAHHYALAMFFSLVVLGRWLSEHRTMFGVVAVLACLTWMTVVLQLDRVSPPPGDESAVSFGKDQILRYVKEDGLEDRVVDFQDKWGVYYILLSFGSRNSLVMYEPRINGRVKPATLEYLVSVAEQTHRNLLVMTDSGEESFRASYVDHLGEPVSRKKFGYWTVAEFSVSR
jgi:hypothetical protein